MSTKATEVECEEGLNRKIFGTVAVGELTKGLLKCTELSRNVSHTCYDPWPISLHEWTRESGSDGAKENQRRRKADHVVFATWGEKIERFRESEPEARGWPLGERLVFIRPRCGPSKNLRVLGRQSRRVHDSIGISWFCERAMAPKRRNASCMNISSSVMHPVMHRGRPIDGVYVLSLFHFYCDVFRKASLNEVAILWCKSFV
jgi:hypothetical protein